MQRDRNIGEADGLDRLVELDLVAADGEALGGQQFGDVAGRHRAVELAGLAGRAHDDEALAVELLGDLAGLRLALEGAGFELGALALELLLVGFVGAQRLALREQEVAGESVPDLDGVAHLAEAGNTLEENDFHGFVPSILAPAVRRAPNELEQVRKQKGVVAGVAVLPVWQLEVYGLNSGFETYPLRRPSPWVEAGGKPPASILLA